VHRIERELPRPFVPSRSVSSATAPYTLLRPFRGPGEAYLAATAAGELCVVQIAPGALQQPALESQLSAWLAVANDRAQLRHPALVALLDAGTIDDSLFVVTEYVPGRDLQELLAQAQTRQRSLPVQLLLHIARELSRGLAHLHSSTAAVDGVGARAIGHGAVLAENTLCGWDGQVQLADRDLSGLFAAAGLRTPLSRLRPPRAGSDAPKPPTAAADLSALATMLSDSAGGALLGLSSALLSLFQQATGGKGSAPPWALPISAEDLRLSLTRELARLRAGRPDSDGETAQLRQLLAEVFGEQGDNERHEAERWIDAVRRTATRSSGRPGSQPSVTSDGPGRSDDGKPARASGPQASAAKISGELRSTGGSGESPSTTADALVIDGRYRLLRLIGIGGMGAVYEAQHVAIGKRIAVKVLHQQFSQHPDLVERLRREAQAASRIGHPNIVDVIDFGYTSDGSAYIAMEYLEGTDLGAILRNEGRVQEPRALRIGLQTARALAAAHRAGIVHRDLKPENIFLVRPLPSSLGGAYSGPLPERSARVELGEGEAEFDLVKVLDFGVAGHLGAGGAWPALPPSQLPPTSPLRQLPGSARLTNPGLAVGTPEYMAPEQALGQEVDARADIYAVGTLLFEMLCGRVPFVASSAAELLALKTGMAPPSPRTFAPTISFQLETLILRCLSQKSEDRPQSMEEVERGLVELARDVGMLSQPRLLLPASAISGGPLASPSAATGAASLFASVDDLAAISATGFLGSPLGSATSQGPSVPSQDALPQAVTAAAPTPPARSQAVSLVAALLAVGIVIGGFATARHWMAGRPRTRSDGAPAVGAAPVVVASSPSQESPAPPAVGPPQAASAAMAGAVPRAAGVTPAPADPKVVEVLEGRVPMLFEWARRTVVGGRYVSPPGDNLLELLTRIEDVAPNHPELGRLRSEAAATVLRRGREHLRRKQPLDALELYRALLAIESGAATASAVRASSKPTGLARKFPRSELVLQLLYVARTGRGGRSTGTAAQLAAAHGAVEIAPRSAAAHLALADAFLAASRREAAASEYRRVLELHPRSLERRLAEHGLGRLGLRPPARSRGR